MRLHRRKLRTFSRATTARTMGTREVRDASREQQLHEVSAERYRTILLERFDVLEHLALKVDGDRAALEQRPSYLLPVDAQEVLLVRADGHEAVLGELQADECVVGMQSSMLVFFKQRLANEVLHVVFEPLALAAPEGGQMAPIGRVEVARGRGGERQRSTAASDRDPLRRPDRWLR